MSGSRRAFLHAALPAGLALGLPPSAARQTGLPPASKDLLEAFGLNYPIFQAGFGPVTSVPLATAVSNGCPSPGRRPGDGDVIGTRPNGDRLLRYSNQSPLVGFEGKMTECPLYAG